MKNSELRIRNRTQHGPISLGMVTRSCCRILSFDLISFKFLSVSLCLCAGFFSLSSGWGQTLPPAPGATVHTITKPGFFNEPSIAINPANPDQIVAAYQVNASVVYSHDGGAHWTPASGTDPANYRMSGDVSVAFDANGRAYLCYIAFDKLGTDDYWGHNASRNGIFVRRSTDGGATWDPLAIPVVVHPPLPKIPFEDKPYIVADTQPHSPFRGNLYVGWTEFTLNESVILFSHSIDGGTTWSTPIRISTHAGLPRDDNGSDEGFTAAVDSDGSVHVVWAEGQEISFTSSYDGGRTFSPSHGIVSIAPPYFQVHGVSRANGFPQIGWGTCPRIPPVAGFPQRITRLLFPPCSRRGVLYVTWSDFRNGDVDVFAIMSHNGGRRWSPPVRVNSDPLHNGADQFFQWLAVDSAAATPAAYVMFYDRRSDPQNQKATIVLARSIDGGHTWLNYAWTDQPFAALGDFLGDYTGLAALNGRVYGAWTEEAEGSHTGASAGSVDSTPAGKTDPKRQEANAAADQNEDSTIAPRPRHQTVVRIGSAHFTH